jgi:hypothetical protein
MHGTPHSVSRGTDRGNIVTQRDTPYQCPVLCAQTSNILAGDSLPVQIDGCLGLLHSLYVSLSGANTVLLSSLLSIGLQECSLEAVGWRP